MQAPKIIAFLLLSTFSGFTLHPNKTLHKLAEIPTGYWLCMGAHVALANQNTFKELLHYRPNAKRWLARLPQSHNEVRALILERLNEYRIPYENNIQIKQVDGLSSTLKLKNKNLFFINRDDHNKLVNILNKKRNNLRLSKEDEGFLAYFIFCLDREFERPLVNFPIPGFIFPLINPLVQYVTWKVFIENDSSERFFTPSFFQSEQDLKELLKCVTFLIGTALIENVVADKFVNFNKRFQDRCATHAAFIHMNGGYREGVETSKKCARELERRYNTSNNQLIDKLISELKNPLPKQLGLQIYGNWIHYIFLYSHQQYKNDPFSQEGIAAFRAWILKQTHIIEKLQIINNPKHVPDIYVMNFFKEYKYWPEEQTVGHEQSNSNNYQRPAARMAG